jgi:solute carrier family 9 (sodium/hydrogen exchanger), member 6/7
MLGIVSLLFCGITLKHYAYHNMSRRTRIATKYLFQVLAQMSENFIFIYLGLSLFTMTELVFKPTIIVITTLAICAARWCAVFPTSYLINLITRQRQRHQGLHPEEDEIPQSYQVMLFWAGLRGAVGVALAAGLDDPNSSPTLKATVLIVVVLTVIIFGGTTARMLEIVGVRTNVVSEDVDSDDDDFLDHAPDLEEWTAVRTNGNATSRRSIPLETSASIARAGRSYPSKPQNGGPRTDPFSISDEEPESDNESTASDLPPRAGPLNSSPHLQSPNRSNTGTPTGSRLGRVGNILGASLDERAKWFLEFDQNVLKPVLLQGKNGEDNSPGRE